MASYSVSWMDQLPTEVRGGSITVGNFDGVHLGHQRLIAVAQRYSKSSQGPTVAVTFDPPPMSLLYPGSAKSPLTTAEHRDALLHEAGADHVVVLKTDPGLLSLSPIAFFEDVIIGLLNADSVVEGENFRFGRGRAGDNAHLWEFCKAYGRNFEEVPVVLQDGEPISSSRVRSALTQGDVRSAEKLLGRYYRIAGQVIRGAQRGRTIGFPTANLGEVATLLPDVGVYAVRAEVDGKKYPGAANIGPNPTFGEDERKIEIHLLNFTGDIYHHFMKVEFIDRIRKTVTFSSVPQLIEQIGEDIRNARQLFSANSFDVH